MAKSFEAYSPKKPHFKRRGHQNVTIASGHKKCENFALRVEREKKQPKFIQDQAGNHIEFATLDKPETSGPFFLHRESRNKYCNLIKCNFLKNTPRTRNAVGGNVSLIENFWTYNNL